MVGIYAFIVSGCETLLALVIMTSFKPNNPGKYSKHTLIRTKGLRTS